VHSVRVTRPIGSVTYRAPSGARTLANSAAAFSVPRESSRSPYRPRPTCSMVWRQLRDGTARSANGRARRSPATFAI
jgi:hypothetical protein